MPRTSRRRARAHLAVALGVLAASGGLLAGVANAQPSDKVLAREIDVKLSDLPTTIHWTSAAQPPNTALENAADKHILLCVEHADPHAPVSTDPFGLIGKPGGEVTADVESPLFSKDDTAQLPGVDSDVTFLKAAAGALGDLGAFGGKAVPGCIASGAAEVAAAAIGSGAKVHASGSFEAIPHHGDGSGGLDVRVAITAAGVTLYEDIYCYVQGRAEVSIDLTDEGSPFPASSAASIAAAVMARAKALAG